MSFIKKLPPILQTKTNKKFFQATFDQMFSKKDSTYLSGYLGRREGGNFDPIKDFYIPEPTKNRTRWQLEPTSVAYDANNNKTNILFYEDLLSYINYYGGNTFNQGRLFDSEYYTFAPPIDYDMFINYQNYYWIPDGLPVITITGVTSADIIGKSSFTTPSTATPANLTLSSGMTIEIPGDPICSTPMIIENIGGCTGIRLAHLSKNYTVGDTYDFLPWDGITKGTNVTLDNTKWDSTNWEIKYNTASADYVTMERGSLDQNIWSSTNRWYHIDVINAVVEQTEVYPNNIYRGLRPIIQFVADMVLYNSGTQFKDNISYGFLNSSNGNPILMSDVNNASIWDINTLLGITFSDGEIILFANDPDNKTQLYKVNITNNIITLTQYGSSIINGDIIFVVSSTNILGVDNSITAGDTWYYDGTKWKESTNNKEKINNNVPTPLFQLYDINGIPLNDPITYPNSTFTGSKVFAYSLDTTAGAPIDPVLGFPILYTALGQASDILFENSLITDRYTYSTNLTNIDGYYYYKLSSNNTLFNNWDLYNPINCGAPVGKNTNSKQRIKDSFAVGYNGTGIFPLSVVPDGYPVLPDIIVTVNGTIVQSLLNDPINGYSVVALNDQVYVDVSNYITNVVNLTSQSQPAVVEIRTYSTGLLDPNSNGYYEIPQQLEANPIQGEVTTLSGSNLIQHFSSIMQNQTGFIGTTFGGSNNYRDTYKNRSLGTYILQNIAPVLKAMLPMSDKNLDLISAIRFSSDQYTIFKNRFLNTASHLINTGFDPLQYHNNTIIINSWVEEILNTINVANEYSDAFAYSYMVASGTPYATETDVIPTNGLLTLTNYINLTDLTNSLYIYDTTVHENLLMVGVDYTIASTNNEIAIQFNLSSPNIGVGHSVTINLYKSPLPAYIPSTPSKLGLSPVYVPQIKIDHTYMSPIYVIIGHDGSKTVAFGDYRDQLLLNLETRIYNHIVSKFKNEYNIPVRLEDIQPGYFRKTRYSRTEFLNITESYINKWTAKNKANYRENDWATLSTLSNVISNFTPGVGNIWKLYNYSRAVDSNNKWLKLPGNWKGIFQYYYDTTSPDTAPWEMLGFSTKPTWWEIEYGAPLTNIAGEDVWGSSAAGLHNMWADLESGIIRQGPTSYYDPTTLQPIPNSNWARPGLSALIPVTTGGEIIPIPTLFKINFSGNYYEPFDYFDLNWKYGDGAPVEQAWYASSAYLYSVQEMLYINNPAIYGEMMWDRYGTDIVSTATSTVMNIELPITGGVNYQYLQNDVYKSISGQETWMRPKNHNQYVHAENYNGVTQIRFGYQAWISDRLLFLGLDLTNNFGQKIRTLNVNLGNKLSGFTNKDTTQLYIEAVSPTATTNSLAVPTDNFEVQLYQSPIMGTYSYSGIIIQTLGDGTFAVFGYDLLNASFTVLNRANTNSQLITIGGQPESFRYFESGQTYDAGEIVRYNSVYYRSLKLQTITTFGTGSFLKLSTLPMTGGVSVEYYPDSLTTITTYPYGTVINSVQELFNLIIGYGAFLEYKGWLFDNVDSDTGIVNDWLYSAKQFLFWINTSWEAGSIIQLSPLANKASLKVKGGYPSDVNTMSNGVYSILDKYGTAIPARNIEVERDGTMITIAPTDLSAGGIYYLQVNTTTTEHIILLDNETSFSDIIYDSLLKARQHRIQFNGFRSNGWYGKMEAPGYFVNGDALVPNFDTIVDSMRYYYDSDVILDNDSFEDLGHHLIGFDDSPYLNNMQVGENIQYLFYQGAIRQKGTTKALNALFRSDVIQNSDSLKVYEEWALKLEEFGNAIEQVSTEFILSPEQSTGQVVVARLNFEPATIGGVGAINILNAEAVHTTIPTIVISAPDAQPDLPWSVFSEYVNYSVGAVVLYRDQYGNAVYYSSNTNQSAGVFNPLNWTVILTTRIAQAYAILNSAGIISRVDVTDPGRGYTSAPIITIDGATTEKDRIYAVWKGEVSTDIIPDNIVNISINDPGTWLIRPEDPSRSLVFPTTTKIDYPTPNAGYVNVNDVDWMSINVVNTVVNWGTDELNPKANDTIWIAKTFTNEWDVFKLTDVQTNWAIVADNSGDLILLTPAGATSNISVNSYTGGSGAVILPIINSSGSITGVTITSTGVNYSIGDTVAASREVGATSGYIDATFTITSVSINGGITGVTVGNPGVNTGYQAEPSVTITPSYWVTQGTYTTHFGNIICAQQLSNGIPLHSANYGVGFIPYNGSDYMNPGTYIDPNTLITYNAYYLTTLSGTQLTKTDIGNYADIDHLLMFNTMRFETTPTSIPAYLSEGDKVWIDNGNIWNAISNSFGEQTDLWNVSIYNTTHTTGVAPFTLFRQQEPLIDTSLFSYAAVFSSLTNNELIQLPVFDPFKDILPGIAKQNITYITSVDPATYNITGDPSLFNSSITFADRQVGQLWWDTSTSAYLYYEQPKALDSSESDVDNLVYRRDNWGQLFPGSVITIWEWTSSPVPPSSYTGSGTPKSATTYVQITAPDPYTGIVNTTYYFWVTNVTTQPNLVYRTLSATEVALMLQSPASQGITYFSPIHQTATNNAYTFYNVLEILAYQGNNIQIKYRQSERNDQKHAQWCLMREGDTGSLVADQYWNKMVDSLCGYTQLFPASDNYNGIIYGDYLPWDVYGWDISPWDNATSTTTPYYGIVMPVPDPTLSSEEAYGIKYRPRQSMFVNRVNALKVFVSAVNALLAYIAIRDNNPAWGTSLPQWSTTGLTDQYYGTYWTYTDWFLAGYENATPTKAYNTLLDANTALNAGLLSPTDIIEVINGTPDNRYVLYCLTSGNIAGEYTLTEVGIQNSAIKLLPALYTSANLFSTPTSLRAMLYALRTQVMVGSYLVDQNNLFFSMLNYVLSEQRTPDWVFKTSYIYIKEDGLSLTQPNVYVPDQTANITDFIIDNKPYHVQVRDYTSSYNVSDTAYVTASEESYKFKVTMQYGPNYAGAVTSVTNYLFDAQYFTTNFNQIISQENVLSIPLTNFDSGKVGMSKLYPYTFSIDTLYENPAQTFITPTDIVSVQVGTTLLFYGKDYYVEFNNDNTSNSDGTYTVYLYNAPTTGVTPTAIIWIDGGGLVEVQSEADNSETALVLPTDSYVINVDTQLPLNNDNGVYSAISDMWDYHDTVINDIVTSAPFNGKKMGFGNGRWDQGTTASIVTSPSHIISSREIANDSYGSIYFRNNDASKGTLVNAINMPTLSTENLDVIIVTAASDIFPEPTNNKPGIIWVDSERIEYKEKVELTATTWQLNYILRGSEQSGIATHAVGAQVFVETTNVMQSTANIDVWNAVDKLPANGGNTNVTSVPLGGLWYAQTKEATFLKQGVGNYNES